MAGRLRRNQQARQRQRGLCCRETIAGFTEGVNLPPAVSGRTPNGEDRGPEPRLIIRHPRIMLSKKTACFKLKQAEACGTGVIRP
jgi:hypothetical protein